MTIKIDQSELLSALDEVAVFDTQVFKDDDRVWHSVPHPHDDLLVRVHLDGASTVFQLFNHKQSEVVSSETLEVSGEPQAFFEDNLQVFLRDWREIVL